MCPEVERYKHFSPAFKKQTVDLIAGGLIEITGTKMGTSLEKQKDRPERRSLSPLIRDLLAEPTGLEPATSDVTGRRSNQLNYDSALQTFNLGSAANLMGGTGFEPVAPGL